MSRPDPNLDQARELFARASDRLDQGMAFRLRRAREAALRPESAGPRRRFLPAGAVAACVMALGLAWWLPAGLGPESPVAAPLANDEVEALVMAEDAELYAWLAEAPVAAPGDPR